VTSIRSLSRFFGVTLNPQSFKYPDVNQNREHDLKRVARQAIAAFDKSEIVGVLSMYLDLARVCGLGKVSQCALLVPRLA
jgi:hypothetical protein